MFHLNIICIKLLSVFNDRDHVLTPQTFRERNVAANCKERLPVHLQTPLLHAASVFFPSYPVTFALDSSDVDVHVLPAALGFANGEVVLILWTRKVVFFPFEFKRNIMASCL